MGDRRGWRRCFKRLSPADQALLRKMILPINWYPLDLNLRLDAAIADVLSPEDRTRAFMDMGRASADENLKGAQHVFVRQGDPHFLLSQAPQIYRFYYAVGSRTYEQTGAALRHPAHLRRGERHRDGLPHHRRLAPARHRAVRRQGRAHHPPQVRRPGAPHCEYHCQWD